MLSEDPMEAMAFRFLSFGPFALREHLGSPSCRVDGGGDPWEGLGEEEASCWLSGMLA